MDGRVSSLALLGLLACGSDSKKPEASGVAAQLAQAACRNLLECRYVYGDASALRAAFGVFGGCESYLLEIIGDGTTTLFGRDVTQMTLQPEQLAACVTRFPQQCFAFEAEEPEDSLRSICAEIYDGNVAPNEICKDDLDCKGDAYCDRTEGMACERGRCTARRGKGEPCLGDNECSTQGAEGVRCTGYEDEPGICALVTQVTHVGANAPCGMLEGARVDERTVAICSDGLGCAQKDDDTGSCVPLIAEGQACEEREECVAGASCLPLTASRRAWQCARVEIRKLGESCVRDLTVSETQFCDLALNCDDTRHCVPHVLAKEGESCEQNACEPGLDCVFNDRNADRTCLHLRAVGEACMFSSDCESDICSGPAGARVCAADPCR